MFVYGPIVVANHNLWVVGLSRGRSFSKEAQFQKWANYKSFYANCNYVITTTYLLPSHQATKPEDSIHTKPAV